jgi:UDP-N-acetylmuramyl pentapeptide phosphotransferase/UDP-N-acetylglucosamine-1-phosphate transferase
VLLWLILYAAIGAMGTVLARRYALQRNLLDHPGDRRSHRVSTPRGGGVAIVSALLIAVIALVARDPAQRVLLAGFGIGLALVAGVGMVDDHRPLSPWLRLAVHALAGLVFAGAIQLAFGDLWLTLLAVVLVLVLTNVWNFMDGINGLATSQALLLGLALALLLGGSWRLLAAALAAACAGFLPFNFPVARIFLGDVGSGAIGFSIAAMIVVCAAEDAVALMWLLLPLSVFLLDAGITLSRRFVNGERWWTPHTRHAYQVWARRAGHTKVTLAYAGCTAVGVMVTALFGTVSMPLVLWVCVGWYIAGALAWRGLQRMEPRIEPERKDIG